MVATPFTIDLNLNDPFCITDHDTPVDDDDTVYNLSRKNKKLKEMLTAVLDEYNSLTTHVKKLMEDKEERESSPIKRKLDHDETVEQGSWKRPKEDLPVSGIKRVYVKVDPSDKSLVVKDGYQWRKYGQKVTRDNPSPRAYYKCSFAPICPVKKKVQRSVDDDGVVVATYEGEHNHRSPMQEAAYALANKRDISTSERWFDSPKQLDEVLVEQMANYLCKDPNFTSELAAAITSRLQDLRRKFLPSMLMD